MNRTARRRPCPAAAAERRRRHGRPGDRHRRIGRRANKIVVVNGQPYTFEGQPSELKPADIKVGEKVRLQFNVNTIVVYEADHAK